jgi:ribulose-phosphate 3-epimerase
MIIPSILEDNLESFQKRIEQVKGFVKKVHIDVLDNTLSPFQTVLVKDIANLKIDIDSELHLMVQSPSGYIEDIKKINPSRVIIHKEIENFEEESELFSDFEVYVGVDLHSSLPDSLDNKFSGILLMSVEIGKSGQEFDPLVFGKIKKAVEFSPNIEVDGGINEHNIGVCKSFGANDFAIHTAIYGKENIGEAIKNLDQI